jgi:hypothetical protein
MKRLSSVMSWRYRHAGSIDNYLSQRGSSKPAGFRSELRCFEWSQLWFLMRDLLKKEGVHRPKYRSTALPGGSHV